MTAGISGWVQSMCVLVLALLISMPGLSQGIPEVVMDDLLDQMTDGDGIWTGTGSIRGTQLTERQHWEWILGHRFVQMNGQRTITTPTGETAEANLLLIIHPTEDGYEGVFLNDLGTFDPISGTLENGLLVLDQARDQGVIRGSLGITGETAQLVLSVPDNTGWIEQGQITLMRSQGKAQ